MKFWHTEAAGQGVLLMLADLLPTAKLIWEHLLEVYGSHVREASDAA